MIEIRKTEAYAKWLDGLRDMRARARILVRVERLASGNPGDVRPEGEGVSELRVDYGPGYRVYFKKQELGLIILWLVGTNALRPKISRMPWTSHATCRMES